MGRHGRTPEEVYRNPRLNMTAKVVYGVLAMFHNGRIGHCRASHATLCQSLGITERPLVYALRALERESEIISHHECGKQTWYELPRLESETPTPAGISTCAPAEPSSTAPAGSSTPVLLETAPTPAETGAPPSPPFLSFPPSTPLCVSSARDAREAGHTQVPVQKTETDREPQNRDHGRVHYSVDHDPGFEPDPLFRANDFLTQWRESGLPLPRSIHWAVHEEALAALHQQPPHWAREQIRQAIDKLVADFRGPRLLFWAWKGGPAYLARRRPGEMQGIEKVLEWEPFNGKVKEDPPGLKELDERVRRYSEAARRRQV